MPAVEAVLSMELIAAAAKLAMHAPIGVAGVHALIGHYAGAAAMLQVVGSSPKWLAEFALAQEALQLVVHQRRPVHEAWEAAKAKLQMTDRPAPETTA